MTLRTWACPQQGNANTDTRHIRLGYYQIPNKPVLHKLYAVRKTVLVNKWILLSYVTPPTSSCGVA